MVCFVQMSNEASATPSISFTWCIQHKLVDRLQNRNKLTLEFRGASRLDQKTADAGLGHRNYLRLF
jgi:hypothetical protein